MPSIFHPDKLPLEQLSFVTPFCTTDVAAVTDAMEKLYEDIPAMAEQYDKFNQVRLAGTGVDSYELISSKPVRTFEDMRGMKIGTAGAATAWMKGVDVVPVQSNMMEYYNSTQSGVYDAFIIMPSTMPGMNYAEVAPYVTELNYGAMYAAVLTMNKDSLAELPEEVQKIILRSERNTVRSPTKPMKPLVKRRSRSWARWRDRAHRLPRRRTHGMGKRHGQPRQGMGRRAGGRRSSGAGGARGLHERAARGRRHLRARLGQRVI